MLRSLWSIKLILCSLWNSKLFFSACVSANDEVRSPTVDIKGI